MCTRIIASRGGKEEERKGEHAFISDKSFAAFFSVSCDFETLVFCSSVGTLDRLRMVLCLERWNNTYAECPGGNDDIGEEGSYSA